MSNTITSANAVFMLAVTDLFPVPQQLQGFAADDIFDTEALTPAEVVMGVDGKLSAGYTPVPTKQNISLQADSDSNLIFEAWHLAQQTAKEVYFASAIVRLPSVSKSYVLTNGVLTSYMPIPDAKKILQPRKFQITWESVVGAPI
ncbi:phage tail fiber protein [Burkholderia multivorans]|uniref:phage tail fiber protein n=2 Tax=Burkholderia multivorans TaxID=87883 RepID=UPI000665E539|nr:hypothetical protein [Burkholderia multivorans]